MPADHARQRSGVPACFTAAWITTALTVDSSGLWVVGAVLVGFGSTVGAAVMLGLATAVDAGARRIRRSPSTHV